MRNQKVRRVGRGARTGSQQCRHTALPGPGSTGATVDRHPTWPGVRAGRAVKRRPPLQRSLLLSARKEPGKYVEGVVLADNLETPFRNVPPSLSLALAMAEKHEKAERAEIMRERRCSELEAVHIVAERIAAKRGG